MKRLATALVVGLAASSFAQNPVSTAAKVTFTCRAERVERLLADLSKATNVRLEATNTMKGEILVVSVNDVPLSELMARIATVTSGEWQTLPDGFRLTQSNRLRNQEERQALDARVSALKKSIQDHVSKPVDPKAQNNVSISTGTNGGQVSAGGPENDRMYRIASHIDINSVARMGSGERIVFSTQPTQMQRPFSGSIMEDVGALVKEHNASIAKSDGKDDAELAQMPDFIKKMAERMTKPIGQVSKAVLVVSRMSFASFGMFTTELRLYDPQGKVAYSMPGVLDMPGAGLSEIAADMGINIPGTKPNETPTSSTPVELSSDTEAILKAFQSSSGQPNKGISFTPEVRQKIYHPDQYDPLSFLATDQVLALAKKRGKPVVASLPDDSVSMLTMVMPNKKPTVEEFERTLNRATEIQTVQDNDWLVIKPAKPSEARNNRLDRDALAALMQTAEQKGLPSLDDIAAFSLKAPSPMEGGLGQLYVLYFVPGVISQGLSGFTSWETLRFYGSMEPDRRNNLLAGQKVPFGSLTPYQRQQVEKMVYGAPPALEVEDPASKGEEIPSYLRAFMSQSGDYQEEPTELLPTGLPNAGYVTVTLSKEPFASPVADGNGGMPGTMAIMDAEMLAMFRMLKETPAYASMSSMLPSPEKVRVGERTNLAFTFQVAPKVSAHQTLNDNRLPSNAPVVAFANLPDGFQKLIAEKLEAVKKSPLGALSVLAGSMGGGTIKP